MSIFNVTGGGGTSLNFKVVGGTTAPASPKENTIWVNTDVEITSWIFAAEEPSPAEAGMVWISTGTASNVAFNALKKNNVQVYPISAKQYIDGAWVFKEAETYQGGEWKGVLKLTFYKDGVQYVQFSDYDGDTKGSLVFEDGYAILSVPSEGTHHMWTVDDIDISAYTSLYLKYSALGSGGEANFKLMTDDGMVITRATSANVSGTLSIDTSEIEGAYHIGAMIYASKASSMQVLEMGGSA